MNNPTHAEQAKQHVMDLLSLTLSPVKTWTADSSRRMAGLVMAVVQPLIWNACASYLRGTAEAIRQSRLPGDAIRADAITEAAEWLETRAEQLKAGTND